MKRHETIRSWLQRKAKSISLWSALGGFGVLFLAVIVLLITFWCTYLILYLLDGVFPHTVATRLWISGIVLVLLFIGNATADRRYLENLSFTTGTFHKKPVSIGRFSTINPLAPDSAQSYVKMGAGFLCFGPRLTVAAVQLFARAWRFTTLDIEGCASVLELLADRDEPVPLSDIESAIPKGHDVWLVLAQIQQIDGIRQTTSDPPELALYSELRRQLPKRGRKSERT